MYISWWVYFVTGLSYVLEQPSTARLAKTKADIIKKSSHSYSTCWVIIKRISLVTKFNKVCLSLFNGVYVNPSVDVQHWKGWYIHYFFFLPQKNILTFRRPWISSSGFAVWRTLVAKEPIYITDELQYILARISKFGLIIMKHLVEGRLAVPAKMPVHSQLYFHKCASSNPVGCFWWRL